MISIKPVLPGPGQESVWDYPRPPRLEATGKKIVVVFNNVKIAESVRVCRVLETSHPPNYYIPPEDIRMDRLVKGAGTSLCEWKGQAQYFDVVDGQKRSRSAAWFYNNPSAEFREIRGFVAFYAGRVDACYVDGEKVTPQPGRFYGGWITSRIVGPFKGVAGSSFW